MGFWDSIGDAFTSFGDDVANVATTGADAIANTATTAYHAVANVATTGADDVANVATTGANDIKNIAVSGADLVANFSTGTLKNFAEGALVKALSLVGLGGSNPNVSGSQTDESYVILIVGGIVGLMLLLLIFDLLGAIF